MTRRTERVNDLLQEELSAIIQRELKDPRLGEGLLTVTEVRVSPDLRQATAYVSHMGDLAERSGILRALESASHWIHGELVRRLKMRHVPEIAFEFDPTIERGARIAALLHEVRGTLPEDATPGDG
jgi:ribosome-binding factor A